MRKKELGIDEFRKFIEQKQANEAERPVSEMSEMVERVARAIFAAHHGDKQPVLDDTLYRNAMARAAIEAMRKPNTGMTCTLAAALVCFHEDEVTVGEVWNRIIDEALKD